MFSRGSPLAFGIGSGGSLVGHVARWGHLTGGTLFLVLVTLGALLVTNRYAFEPRVARTLDSTRVMRLNHEAMLDQETGLRGYLLSRDERFLEAYERGHDALATLDPEARQLLSGSGRPGELFLDVRLAQQAWIDDWATEALRLGRSQDTSASDAFLQLDKALFDVYRQRYDVLITALVDRRDDAVQTQSQALLLALSFAIAVTAGAGAMGLQRGRALRRAVGIPLGDLLARLEGIRAGELSPQPIVDGPAEFRALSTGLEDTAATLSAARVQSAHHAEQIEARSRRQNSVLRLAREVAGSLNLRYVLRGVCTHAAAIADNTRVVVWLTASSGDELEACADSAATDLEPVGFAPVALGAGIVGRAGSVGRIQSRDDASNDEPDVLAVPMVVGAHVIGVLELRGQSITDLPRDVVDILETLAVHAATAIDAARLHEHTAALAVTDVLTGLPNRRRLDSDLAMECAASIRYQRPLSFLMIDVDHFKSYNDTLGHQAADVALQELARVISHGLRDSDTPYRYGGEEFALILRETSTDEALVVAERLRDAVEHNFAAPSQPRAVTVSIGVATMPEHGPTPQALATAADEALYRAKHAGRNRVCAVEHPPLTEPENRQHLRAVDNAD